MSILQFIEIESYILLNQVLLFIVSSLSLYWGVSVYLQDKSKKTNILFLLVSIFFVFWPLFGYLSFFSFDSEQAIFWLRFAYAAVSLFVISFFYLFIYFLNEKGKHKATEKFVVIGGIGLILLSFLTNNIISNVSVVEVGIKPSFSWGAYIFYVYVLTVFLFIFQRLFVNYEEASKLKRKKIQYFFIGTGIFLILNIVFNILIPVLRESYDLHQFANYSPIFFIGFTAYAITKENLFNVRAALTTIFIGSIAILLSIDLLFFTPTVWMQTFKGFVLVSFLAFGRYLIKNIIGEIQRREELEKLSDELVDTNIKLKEANKKLRKLDKAKSEFISIASHQLRTPLTAIKGYLSMIAEGSYGEVPEKAKEKMESVLGSSERLIGLVNDLLNVSRIESGKIEMNFNKIDIEEFIKDSVKELQIVAEEEGLYLNYEVENGLTAAIDEERMRQVILNIIDNAIKYTADGGITITGKKQELKSGKDSALIKIKDTGEGMTQKDIDNIFDSFSRGSAGDLMHTEGAGLGLYIAKKFVDMHNGSIWIESEGKGKGTCFFIELPLKQN